MQDPHDVTSALWVLALTAGLALWTLAVCARLCTALCWERLAPRLGIQSAKRRIEDRKDRRLARRAIAEILADPDTQDMLHHRD